jgi:uncharacterized membrane protein
LLGLVVLFGFVVLLLQIRVLEYAYERIGIKRHWVFFLLLLSVAGSAINIPIAELRRERIVSGAESSLNLPYIQGLGAPIASIGGGGTFDSVFLTGILAVLLTYRGEARHHPPNLALTHATFVAIGRGEN